MSDQPIPCACGGFWPDDHVQGCTNLAMSKLWPKSYRKELEQRERKFVAVGGACTAEDFLE